MNAIIENYPVEHSSLPSELSGSDEFTSSEFATDYQSVLSESRGSFFDELSDLRTLYEEKEDREQEIRAEAELKELFKDLNRQVYAINPLGLSPFSTHEAEKPTTNSRIEELVSSKDLDFEKNERLDPIINLDREKLKITIDFPMLESLRRVDVQYDPATRSVIAEMVTSQEAARILQGQVSDLERNLGKHNIRLQSLRITPSNPGQDSGSFSQHRQPGDRSFEYH